MLSLVATFFAASLCAALALVYRWQVVRDLGPSYVGRYWLVQGLFINATLLAVWHWVTHTMQLTSDVSAVVLNVAYVVIFYFYSVANVDWTLKKFHAQDT
ncbi:MAG: hypothetical protein VKN33_01695 [Candidatus Sericytochromatia bacterium]|nr:hypothetical protein [Candidatus Sericytochromatia bacterium]